MYRNFGHTKIIGPGTDRHTGLSHLLREWLRVWGTVLKRKVVVIKFRLISVFQKLCLLEADLLFIDEEGLGLDFFREKICMASATDQTGLIVIHMSFTAE